MKKLFSNKKAIFFAILTLFVFGQLLGTVVIKAFFINYKIGELSPQLDTISTKIAKGDFTISRENDFIIKAYDVYGKEMDIFSIEAPPEYTVSDQSISSVLTDYIPKILAGMEVATLQKIKGQPSESIVIGTPIVKNSNVIGAVFLLKPASDFTAVLNGFSLVFFGTLLIGTFFIGVFLYLYLKEMKNLEKMRRDYIANISHELKSPICSIKALTETLADGIIQDDATMDKYYHIILKESNRLQKLISDMLELSRLQSVETVFKKERINTKSLIQEIHDKYSILADDMGIVFEVTDTIANAPCIYSCKDRLLQLFDIVIDNAIKHVGENGKIVIDADINRWFVTIKISDNGQGIEKSALPYIFDRFFKMNKAHNSDSSGLGLSIAKELVNGLDENIWVSSNSEKGAEFSFTVKRA